MSNSCNFDAVPYSQSQEIRTPKLFSLNYTNQDFWSMKLRLVRFLEERYADQFTDFVESSLAMMLIENWAFLADTLSFKMDQIVNEMFIDTVTEVDNAFRIAKLVGFNPTPPIPARASFSATIGSLLDTDMVLPTPVLLNVVANDVPTTFELYPEDESGNPVFDDDIIIPAGNFTNTSIIGIEGKTKVNQFDATGQINQTYTLTTIPVLYDSVRVDIDGVQWEQVDYFSDSQPRREFRVEYDSDYKAYVIFGNNKAGAVPPSGSKIRVTYRTGGGAIGNIVSGAINISLPFTVPGFDVTIPVSITNYTKADFGYDGDTIDDIRKKLPQYLRTQNRAVTGDDYKTLANQFVTPYNGQIGKATAVLRNHGCAGNIVDLFVLAKDGNNDLQVATDDLKIALSEELEVKKMFTDHVCIKDGTVITVDVSVGLTVDKFFKKFKEEIEARAVTSITDFFNLRNWDFGQDLRDSDIIKTLSSIREINRADVSFVTNDPDNSGATITTLYYEIIRVGEINISFSFE